MIDIIKNTPREYSKQSRDYQVIARLYSALFNYSKMYIDNMQVWNSDIDDNLAILRAKTLNLDTEHSWDLTDLEAITSCFKYLISRKGAVEAIKSLICILMKVQNLDGTVDNSTVTIKDNNLNIRIEDSLVTMGIIEDLFKYILPAGITYRITQYKSYDINDLVKTNIYYRKDSIESKDYPYSKEMFIGNNKEKQRSITRTFIYSNDHQNWKEIEDN